MNPLRYLYDDFNRGDPAEKWAGLPLFPRMIDVEVTSACNMRCLMCPTGNLSITRPPEFMARETWTKIVGQCEPHGTALRVIGWGEPLLHPEIVGMIGDAATADLLTHINTNGTRMTPALAEMLSDFGLNSIKYSFQGVDAESYADMRGADNFEGLIEAIGIMREARGHNPLPWIAASTSVTDESPERIGGFKQRMAGLVDELTIGRTTFDFMDLDAVRVRPADRERLARLKAAETVEKRHPVPCPEVYGKLSIHADGTAVVCCNDFNGIVALGNVNETPIAEMWRHPKIEAYRERLARKEYTGPLCSVCYDYIGATDAIIG